MRSSIGATLSAVILRRLELDRVPYLLGGSRVPSQCRTIRSRIDILERHMPRSRQMEVEDQLPQS